MHWKTWSVHYYCPITVSYYSCTPGIGEPVVEAARAKRVVREALLHLARAVGHGRDRPRRHESIVVPKLRNEQGAVGNPVNDTMFFVNSA